MKFLKKLLAFIKWLIVGIIWSYIYIVCTWLFFKSIWGFNYLSYSNWQIITRYWNEGGRIKTGKDYLFILCLAIFIPLWIWGWKKLNKTNIINILFQPFLWLQKRQAEKYMKNMSHIKIHNIGISIGDEIKQDFENKLKKQQSDITNSPKTSSSIRNNLTNKLSNK